MKYKYVCRDCLKTVSSNDERPGWFCWKCGVDLICVIYGELAINDEAKL